MSLRLTISFCEIYFMICQFVQVGKDASSYLLKDTKLGPLTLIRLNRWHRDGVIQALLSFLPCAVACYILYGWKGLGLIAAGAALIRLSFYDISFNKWANLDLGFLGTTPKADAVFIAIFGTMGAVRKAIVFTAMLITLQLIIRG